MISVVFYAFSVNKKKKNTNKEKRKFARAFRKINFAYRAARNVPFDKTLSVL